MTHPEPDQPVFTPAEWEHLTQKHLLSQRQIQIADAVVDGMSDKQIATNLNMSVATVRTHLGRLFSKLNVQNRNELILLLLRECRAIYR